MDTWRGWSASEICLLLGDTFWGIFGKWSASWSSKDRDTYWAFLLEVGSWKISRRHRKVLGALVEAEVKTFLKQLCLTTAMTMGQSQKPTPVNYGPLPRCFKVLGYRSASSKNSRLNWNIRDMVSASVGWRLEACNGPEGLKLFGGLESFGGLGFKRNLYRTFVSFGVLLLLVCVWLMLCSFFQQWL